jgi:hypothetical protein
LLEDKTDDALTCAIPTKSGIRRGRAHRPPSLDSRFRGNDIAGDSIKLRQPQDLTSFMTVAFL